jgi:arsenate reductase
MREEDKVCKDVPGILFICTHNACRSILCEAITKELAGAELRVASAGSHPAGQIHPLTLDYLNMSGYSTQGLFSKGLEEVASFMEEVASFKPDVVITVCDRAATENCPIWLDSAVKAHWGFIDPTAIEGSAHSLRCAFDSLAQAIESRVSHLLKAPFHTLPGTNFETIRGGKE